MGEAAHVCAGQWGPVGHGGDKRRIFPPSDGCGGRMLTCTCLSAQPGPRSTVGLSHLGDRQADRPAPPCSQEELRPHGRKGRGEARERAEPSGQTATPRMAQPHGGL